MNQPTKHDVLTNFQIYIPRNRPKTSPDADFSEKVWIERWLPNTQLLNVVETEIKEIFVIEGVWRDELGSYPVGSWLRYPPNCPYSPSSTTGCLIYVKTYPVTYTTARFVVGDDFQHPEAS